MFLSYHRYLSFPLVLNMMDDIKLFVARRKTRGDFEKMRCCNDSTNIGGNKTF